MSESEKSQRLHAYLSGRVQGVGMRFTVQHIARQQELTGWVRNLPDGRVELMAEGPTAALSSFLAELRKSMGHLIRDVLEHYRPATGEWERYDIVY